MNNYLGLLRDVIDNGYSSDERTGTGTLSRFGNQLRFDLSAGFPMVTTRPIWFRGIVEELIWFLSGSTNAYDLPESVQKWWTPWAASDGQLGPTYGESLRAFSVPDGVIEVPHSTELGSDMTKYPRRQLEQPSDSDDEFVGTELETQYGTLLVLSEAGKTPDGHKRYRAQFQNTGTIVSQTKSNITRIIKDRFAPLVAGVGFLGDTIVKRKNPHFFLYAIWSGMIRRCYDPQDVMYPMYGAKGVTVHTQWHNFSNFYRDAQELTNWCFAKNERGQRAWHLDKDYFGSKVYSRSTCVWLTQGDNAPYTGTPITAYHPDGTNSKHINQRECARSLGLHYKGINTVLSGTRPHYKGFTFQYYEGILRKPLPFDQVGWLLNEIRTNPNSRRLVLSTWNASRIGQCRLPPCHGLATQFYVANGKLSCLTYQRSCDTPVGVPANIASYALLTHIIAQMTGLEVGELVYTFGQYHVYNDQIEGVKEQLTRTPKELPQLKINNWGQGINDWQFKDFELVGYDPNPNQIVYPVAV